MITELQRLRHIDRILKELYEERDTILDRIRSVMHEHYNSESSSISVAFPITDVEGKEFARLKITDNVEKLSRGETIYKNTGFSSLSGDFYYTQKAPKDVLLIEEEKKTTKKASKKKVSKTNPIKRAAKKVTKKSSVRRRRKA